jgi:hypothetical protein
VIDVIAGFWSGARVFLGMRLPAGCGPRSAGRLTAASPGLTLPSRAGRLRLLHPSCWAGPSSSQRPRLRWDGGSDQWPRLTAPLSVFRTIRAAVRRLPSWPRPVTRGMRMEASAATLLVLGIIAAGWSTSGQAGGAVSPQLRLHTVALPALPKWVHRKFPSSRYACCVKDGVAVEANGDLLVAFGDSGDCCYLYGFVQFDSRRGRWLPGGILNPTVPGDCFGGCLAATWDFLHIGRTVWMVGDGSVYRARFSSGWSTPRKVVRAGPSRPWRDVYVLTPGRQGRVWVVGSTRSFSSCSDPIASVCGHTVIGLAGSGERHARAIRASRSGTATDATAGPGGSLWVLVPRFRDCTHSSCRRSELIRYDPTRHRLTRHVIPARRWPDIVASPSAIPDGWVYAEPSGTVWVVTVVKAGLRVIRLHHGSFGFRVVRFPGAGWESRPPMDRSGDIWFCNSTAHTVDAVDPRTGKRTILLNRHGTSLLEDMQGRMWYVKADSTGWSSCY